MDKAIRIQRKRAKGWKMPENTVYVGRGSRWGNPFKIVQIGASWSVRLQYEDQRHAKILIENCRYSYNTRTEAQSAAIVCYEKLINPYRHGGVIDDYYFSELYLDSIKTDLKGKNLACWCKEGEPCHADVLLRIANE